jgi:prolyl-tRNA editing enzyme YbaK/EbsC (Cys-tRNA(Pro) deacylase)
MTGEALAPAAQRVQEQLRAAGSPCEVVMRATTARSSAEAAAAIGCTVAQIAKSLVFRAKSSGRAVLVVASGSNRVDEAKIAAALGEPIGKADADFVRDRTGYAIGGVAPVGHDRSVRIFIDADLQRYAEIWAAGGHPHAVFKLTPAELERLTRGTVIAVA